MVIIVGPKACDHKPILAGILAPSRPILVPMKLWVCYNWLIKYNHWLTIYNLSPMALIKHFCSIPLKPYDNIQLGFITFDRG